MNKLITTIENLNHKNSKLKDEMEEQTGTSISHLFFCSAWKLSKTFLLLESSKNIEQKMKQKIEDTDQKNVDLEDEIDEIEGNHMVSIGFIMLLHVFFLFSAIDDMNLFEEELNKMESFAADMRERDKSIEDNIKGKGAESFKKMKINSATFLKQIQKLMFKIEELKSMVLTF